MKRFEITCTLIYNGWCEVEAESEQDAIEKANDMLDAEGPEAPLGITVGKVNFNFGEVTTDYVIK